MGFPQKWPTVHVSVAPLYEAVIVTGPPSRFMAQPGASLTLLVHPAKTRSLTPICRLFGADKRPLATAVLYLVTALRALSMTVVTRSEEPPGCKSLQLAWTTRPPKVPRYLSSGFSSRSLSGL